MTREKTTFLTENCPMKQKQCRQQYKYNYMQLNKPKYNLVYLKVGRHTGMLKPPMKESI